MLTITNPRLKHILLLFSIVFISSSYAQLDSIHYLPPIKPRGTGNSHLNISEVVLSTPSTTPISVTVTTGDGTAITGSPFTVVQGSPTTISVGIGTNPLVIDDAQAGIVQTNNGYILSSVDKFIATYKGRSNNLDQADVYTGKGTLAMGTKFHWCGFPGSPTGAKNSYLSIMAVHDATVVDIIGYDPNCVFRLGAVINGITANNLTINLNAGETYVLECASNQAAANIDGFIGAEITSNNDIVVNNGHANGGNTTLNSSRDLMLEQSIPVSKLGREFITIIGDPSAADIDVEQVIIVAVDNGTTVSVNGGPVVATLNAGQYHIIDGTNYSVNGNMYIECSENVYCYQQLRGGAAQNTVGLNMIPPLNCYLPPSIVEIPAIEDNNGHTMAGGISILTRTGATVLINGVAPTSTPMAVTGNANWVTYKELGLTGNVSVTSTSPMAVCAVVTALNAGSSGYYSGFVDYPGMNVAQAFLSSPTDCIDTIFVEDNFDAYQWLANGVPIPLATDTFYVVGGVGNSIEYSVAVDYAGCLDTSQVSIDCLTPLPVEGLILTGNRFDRWIDLEWTTQLEINNDYFDVLRSEDGQSFTFIGQVDGSGTTIAPSSYALTDENPNFGWNYYRLRQVDFDGSISYSNTVAFQYGMSADEDLLLISPNPSEGISNLYFNANAKQNTLIKVYNSVGQVVYREVAEVVVGENSVSLHLSSLSAGMYFIELNLEGVDPVQVKFIKK